MNKRIFYKNRSNSLFDVLSNNIYNYIFRIRNNIKVDLLEDKQCLEKSLKNIKHSTELRTVWLLNLKRLYYLFLKDTPPYNYHFLDVGCGNGIPIIYAHKKFEFKSFEGFDFVKKYVEISFLNVKNYIKANFSEIDREREREREKSFFSNKKINIFLADANSFKLDKGKSYFVFMFNPFSEFIMKKFLENNIISLKYSKSVLAYANCIHLNLIKKYSLNISVIQKYKLALIRF